ncbi:MAG: GAF domain-containing protein [Phycisphaerae bacterium]
MKRPYEILRADSISLAGDRELRMQGSVDELWNVLHPLGLSWIGFYLDTGDDQLALGPRRDKPACSPIGLHGVCGQAYRERRIVVIRDVAVLGENYVACDPRDRSEVVVPLWDGSHVWGVLDVDSFDVGAFDEHDARELAQFVHAARLSTRSATEIPVRIG